MPRSKKTYDVFLSHSSELEAQARIVAQKFSDAGLTVFDIADLSPGDSIAWETWQALAESWALVVLIGPGTMPPSVAVEIGAASAWHKPIYVLAHRRGEFHMPLYISMCEVYSLSDLDKVIALVTRSLDPLSREERAVLARVYSEFAVPTDRLLREAPAIEQLQERFFKEAGVRVSGERLMQELLRLRKRGKLPRLQRNRRVDK